MIPKNSRVSPLRKIASKIVKQLFILENIDDNWYDDDDDSKQV